MRRRASPSSPRSGIAPERPSSDIVDGVGHQLLPAADPHPAVVDVVLAARRRAHPAQLGVDVRAVEALLVVLDDDLPVGRDLVRVGRPDDEALGLVRSDERARSRRRYSPTAGALPETLTITQPCHSSTRDRDEAVLGAVEAGRGLEPRRRQQRAVEAVAPPVVRAVDRAVFARAPARGQLVGPVLAHVEEAAERSVVAADEQHGVVADGEGPAGAQRSRARRRARRTPTPRRTGAAAPTRGPRRRGRRRRAACGRSRARARPPARAASIGAAGVEAVTELLLIDRASAGG